MTTLSKKERRRIEELKDFAIEYYEDYTFRSVEEIDEEIAKLKSSMKSSCDEFLRDYLKFDEETLKDINERAEYMIKYLEGWKYFIIEY